MTALEALQAFNTHAPFYVFMLVGGFAVLCTMEGLRKRATLVEFLLAGAVAGTALTRFWGSMS